MKGWSSLFLTVLFGFCGCSQTMQVGGRSLSESELYTAKSVSYNCPYKEVWSTVYSVIAEEFSIERETESRGYIESGWKETGAWSYRTKVIAEVLGEGPYRVVIRCPHQVATFSGNGTFRHTGWQDTSDDEGVAKKLSYCVYDRLKSCAIK